MRFIDIKAPGGPEVLHMAEGPKPIARDREVLIKVSYAGVNRPDLMQRAGLYPAPKDASSILGLEASGVIVALGRKVKAWQIGDEVCALLAGGGYAEYVAVDERHCLPIPRNVSLEEAAGFPEALFTVWTNVFDRGRLKRGENFLIHGGASGIGVAAIQMARAMGANVFTTAGSPKKCQRCQELGAFTISYKEEDFAKCLKDMNVKIDVILDMIGGDYLEKNLSVMNTEGRLVNIAYQNGSKLNVNFLPVMLKRLSIMGSTLRVRSPEDKAKIARSLKTHIWPKIENREIIPVIDRVFELEEAALAHTYMEKGDHIGKIILKV